MSLYVNGQRFYRISEACALVGISRMTFLRWVREGTMRDVVHRDWRGWRLFTEDDLVKLKVKVNCIHKMEYHDIKMK